MSQNQSSHSKNEKNPPLHIIRFFNHYGDDVPLNGRSDHTSFSFYGEGNPEDELQYFDNGTPIGRVTVNEFGRFDVGLRNLKDGLHAVHVRAPFGQESFPWKFTIDTSEYPLLDKIMGSDSFVEDGATVDENSLVFHGRADASETLRLFIDDTPVATVRAGDNGLWRALIVELNNGKHTFKLTKPKGQSTRTVTLQIVQRPALPDFVITSVTDSEGQGVPHGGATSDTVLNLEGKARPNENGTIYVGHIAYAGFLADKNGNWVVTLENLNKGVLFFKAKSGIEDRASAAFAIDIREAVV
ncbi:hypothetical protein ACYZT8_02495 [Pseudomonas sp. LB3P93]